MRTRIVAVRHAEPESGSGYADMDLCPLSERGKATHAQTSQHLKKHGLVPTLIYCSPILRAVQTAEIMSEVFAVPYKQEPLLGDAFNASALLGLMPQPGEDQTVILVGHAPTLTAFIHKLIGEEAVPEGICMSGSVIVDFIEPPEFGKGRFVRYYQPIHP
ncbi:MAG: histidine phosphatase family protein [Chlamydiia bacterium]|nr:histidine phosphatase family protein [Chlamydiia bacterium]